jgi:tetratricopeptide (TPR) repeat protein
MRRIEKSVFICYRRTHFPWAKAISQHLSGQGYDVFFDFMSLNSGDFEQLIIENIKARANFLVLLAPSGLERCCDPKDWVRREIEIALDNKRNIVPILIEGFDFGSPEAKKYLTGKLEKLGSYNGINIYAEYFDAAMQKLCDRFLNIPLDEVLHPALHEVSSSVQEIVEEQKRIVAEQPPVEISALSALEWFERAHKTEEPEEKIRLYTKAIELDSNFPIAYSNRGNSFASLKQYERAIEDYNYAIKLDSEYAIAYSNRGVCYNDMKQYERAIEDYNNAIKLDSNNAMIYSNRGNSYNELKQYERAIEDLDRAIKLDPEYSKAYLNRGNSYANLKQIERAIEDYDNAIKLDSKYALAYSNRGNCFCKLKQYERAIEDFDCAIKLDSECESVYYNKACAYALQGQELETIKCLRQAFDKDLNRYYDLTKQDSDFDRLRDSAEFRKLLKEFSDKC